MQTLVLIVLLIAVSPLTTVLGGVLGLYAFALAIKMAAFLSGEPAQGEIFGIVTAGLNDFGRHHLENLASRVDLGL